ncbi:hypothetical protein T03_6201 [Trichinella britovi]|uniref:Uncharacterized protein n=1 Tax=Trichinella britovi TaxID=45882 RepID=A0A0V1C943_TRIBR|nr:hypothetical protein T03_6201 [Trichinella britovi]
MVCLLYYFENLFVILLRPLRNVIFHLRRNYIFCTIADIKYPAGFTAIVIGSKSIQRLKIKFQSSLTKMSESPRNAEAASGC